jgi:hypothetical protein
MILGLLLAGARVHGRLHSDSQYLHLESRGLDELMSLDIDRRTSLAVQQREA